MGTDWAPSVIAVGLFILLSPGLLFQLPSRTRFCEFGNMYTSGIAVLVHAIFNISVQQTDVDVPEWLSGMTRNHVGSARAGSNPAVHVFVFIFLLVL
ncbi:hypothetical protein KY290_003514 [Solanum tuberosum]|uniref:Uncharacterized protein n=1 Tax=Solanum tuberosum TaxID=4113 RepID=A0ABQ7WUI6_SOLTU|nr:hypothetical protein KY284_003646 [Solanum tuberosum]KAH0732652.1 hypothetical protein KY289_003840 [Solanum tuberosum]KAH0767625.1 hypothetical protein KY285_003496 [Solanum tuberosum]KAH0783916.1 hypothetical protein KY290_003514 [Solanum tuberosum]